MTKQQWMKAWIQTGSFYTLSLIEFQDRVMMGTIKLKYVRRSK